MRTTIDAAGRVVIPKALRDEMGLVPGEVELVRDGAAVRIEAVPGDGFEHSHGRLVIPGGEGLDDAAVRRLRLGEQR